MTTPTKEGRGVGGGTTTNRGMAEIVDEYRMAKEDGDISLTGNDHLIKWLVLLFRAFVPVFWPTGGAGSGGGHGLLEKERSLLEST